MSHRDPMSKANQHRLWAIVFPREGYFVNGPGRVVLVRAVDEAAAQVHARDGLDFGEDDGIVVEVTGPVDRTDAWTPVGETLPDEGEPVLVLIADGEPPAVCALTMEVDADGDGPCWRLCAANNPTILVSETVAWRRLPG